MKVLLLCKNLFAIAPNGGSRVYESIISKNPTIQFFAFNDIKAHYKKPGNLQVVNFESSNELKGLERLLSAVSGESFDVIDWPDWIAPQLQARELLHMYKIRFRKLVVSLHGNNSLILETSPLKNELNLEIQSLKRLEEKLYRSCDSTYGISKTYAELLAVDDKFKFIDPGNFIKKFPNSNMFTPQKCLVFLGRRESTKGFGNFLDLLKNSPSGWRGEIYGPDSYSWTEYRYWNLQSYYLRNKISRDSTLTENEVTSLFQQRQGEFIFLSEFDSFNLAFADCMSSGQASIVYDNLPGLKYFTDNGVDIEAITLPKSTTLITKENLSEIFERCAINRAVKLEKMREDIQKMLLGKSQADNYMVGVYGA
jgi:hypothetical protein